MVMKGYLNKPAETQKSLKDGWYHLGRPRFDGTRRIPVHPRPYERHHHQRGREHLLVGDRTGPLFQSGNPGVRCYSQEDPKWGEIPKAIVVLQPGSKLTAQDIVNFTRERMAHFKTLREAEIVQELPKGGTGKILKSVLRKIYGK